MNLMIKNLQENTTKTRVKWLTTLLVTCYCIILNIRQSRLRTGEKILKSVVYIRSSSSNIRKKYIESHDQQNQKSRNVKESFIELKNRTNYGFTFHPLANKLILPDNEKNENKDKDKNEITKYAVISANIFKAHTSIEYLTSIPMSCHLWMKLNFKCFILLIYDRIDPKINDFLATFEKEMAETFFGTVILRIKVDQPYQIISVSQISRLFVASFIKWILEGGNCIFFTWKISSILSLLTEVRR